MNTRKTLLNVKFALLGMVLAATSQAATHSVQVLNGKYDPAELEIVVGDTVEFENVSTGKHTVTGDPTLAKDPANVVLPAGAQAFNSGLLLPGDKFSHVFDVEGDYQYICLPHERMGMMAKIRVLPLVEEPSAPVEPAECVPSLE